MSVVTKLSGGSPQLRHSADRRHHQREAAPIAQSARIGSNRALVRLLGVLVDIARSSKPSDGQSR
jgi:hypothetical protein